MRPKEQDLVLWRLQMLSTQVLDAFVLAPSLSTGAHAKSRIARPKPNFLATSLITFRFCGRVISEVG